MANAATNRKPASKYPATKVSSFRREFNSRCRGYLRFSLFVRASVLKSKKKPRVCCSNEEISGGKVILSDQKPTLKLHKKEKEVTELNDEGHVGDSTSKGSSFKEVQVVEDLVKEDSSTWGVRNGKNGNSLRVSVLRRFPLLVKKHVEVSHEPFLPLKEEDEAAVKSAFSVRNRMKVLVSHKNSNIDICGENLQCLKPCAWLNDEVINLYLELLKERETREAEKYFKCHFFNTFFYIKLASRSGYNYEAVRRWTTQRKLGYNLIDCDIIFVPIHGGVHWTLAVINIRKRKFQFLDSLKGFDPRILKALAKYLVDEVKDKNGKNIDVSSWDMEYVKDLPRQLNGYDCGMFMLKYIDFYSRGLKLHFSQKDMPYFRLRTAKEILRLRAD
uniref:Putative ubiquitin-like-specific protease 1B n=1 Tax=Noccaea caerulescens TaxID=107243 RepID=A0A1J3CWA8_NOCCA